MSLYDFDIDYYFHVLSPTLMIQIFTTIELQKYEFWRIDVWHVTVQRPNLIENYARQWRAKRRTVAYTSRGL